MCGHYAFHSSSPKTPAYINNITSNTNIAFVSMTINVVGIILYPYKFFFAYPFYAIKAAMLNLLVFL